jgi:hypothetical protein
MFLESTTKVRGTLSPVLLALPQSTAADLAVTDQLYA